MLESVLKRYPELTAKDVNLMDNGNGVFVNVWNSNKPKPTTEQINQWYAEDEQLPQPKTEIEILKEQNADLNLQIIDLWENLLIGGVL